MGLGCGSAGTAIRKESREKLEPAHVLALWCVCLVEMQDKGLWEANYMVLDNLKKLSGSGTLPLIVSLKCPGNTKNTSSVIIFLISQEDGHIAQGLEIWNWESYKLLSLLYTGLFSPPPSLAPEPACPLG